MNYAVKNGIIRIVYRSYEFFTGLMDFFNNPYRCGPLRVGMYSSRMTILFSHELDVCFTEPDSSA